MNNHLVDDRVFNQSCAQYLRHLGFDVQDGDSANCPYRPSSDSGAFSITGPLWHDFPTGEGGNVWQLAMRMNGDDKHKAVESLCKSAGVPFVETIENKDVIQILREREKALKALGKVRDAFEITEGKTPQYVLDYLKSRKVTETTLPYFAFIPAGQLTQILSDEEIQLTGLRDRENLIVLWYYKGDRPVYYCTRDIQTKAFRKAFVQNGVLEHPIWNVDALYRDQHVVWGEGMFDCTSLLEVGYGVAGEITCNLHKSHQDELLTALRWRNKNHPEWTFTICLDNDEPKANGRRPGNEAAEKMAIWLWNNGVDVKWVKHDPANEKIDINYLHQHGLEGQIKQMIDGAKHISEIIAVDSKLSLRHFTRMLSNHDYRGASRMASILQTQNPNISISEIVKTTHTFLWKWSEVYVEDIQDVFLFGSDVYVIFNAGRFGINSPHYEVFNKSDFVGNMKRFQRNPVYQIRFTDLEIEYRRPTWRVARDGTAKKDMYNLFSPSPLLVQNPRYGTVIPEQWNALLDNLAGAEEKEWWLNHLAVYVQRLEKPKTIPVLVGPQGTGKTVFARLLGEGIGGFVAVGNTEVESQFNSYLMNAVVLLDELASNQRESNHLKNKLKGFINENQTVNQKYASPFSVDLNNYVIIASNEAVHHVPLVIEKGDRRYTIITGGKDRDLAHEAWFNYTALHDQLPDFILHLLSRPADEQKASVPYANKKKLELTEMGEDLKVAYVREFMEDRVDATIEPARVKLSTLCQEIGERYKLQYQLTSRTLKPILEDLGYEVVKREHQLQVVIPALQHTETSDSAMATFTTTTTTAINSASDLASWADDLDAVDGLAP